MASADLARLVAVGCEAVTRSEAQAADGEVRLTMPEVEGWARQPWSVGCHWYEHADQPVLGRHLDGENQTVGLVDLTGTRYDHLVRAARAASAGMDGWHVEPHRS